MKVAIRLKGSAKVFSTITAQRVKRGKSPRVLFGPFGMKSPPKGGLFWKIPAIAEMNVCADFDEQILFYH